MSAVPTPHERPWPPALATTGLGDLPYDDAARAVDRILDRHPQTPYWPQLPRRSPREGMLGQFLSDFPFLQYRRPAPRLSVSAGSTPMKEALARMRDGVGLPAGELGPRQAEGWHELIGRIDTQDRPRPPFLAGQVTGPLTAASLLADADGRPLLEFSGTLGALAHYLAPFATWQCAEIARRGITPILRLDEPMLQRLQPERDPDAAASIARALAIVVRAAREAGALTVLDPGGAIRSLPGLEVDLVAVDATLGLSFIREHAERLLEWAEQGRGLLLGAVPTARLDARFDPGATAHRLIETWTGSLGSHEAARRLFTRSLLTPATGTLTLDPRRDEAVAAALTEVSTAMRRALDLA